MIDITAVDIVWSDQAGWSQDCWEHHHDSGDVKDKYQCGQVLSQGIEVQKMKLSVLSSSDSTVLNSLGISGAERGRGLNNRPKKNQIEEFLFLIELLLQA